MSDSALASEAVRNASSNGAEKSAVTSDITAGGAPHAKALPPPRALRRISLESANIKEMRELTPHSVRIVPHDFDGELVFHSRHHRKGRFPELRGPTDGSARVHRHQLNLLTFEPDNISWWVAVVFTVGSVFWVVNGARLMSPGDDGGRRNLVIESVAALIAALTFELGAYLAIVEAINPRRHLDFGYEVLHPLSDSEDGRGDAASAQGQQRNIHLRTRAKTPLPSPWRWFALEFHDSGTRAATVRFVGATAVGIASILALPRGGTSEEERLVPERLVITFDVLVIGLQVVGASCFLATAAILMLETQRYWYQPNLWSLGWHVNLWFGFGAMGFLLAAVFDILRDVDGEEICCQRYGTHLCRLLGGIGFLMGSLLLLVEVANKHPRPRPWQSESSDSE